MVNAFILVLSGLAGVAIGAIFFGGLWWTVTAVVTSAHPARWLLGSLLGRTGVTLVGFYLVSGHHLDRLLACVVGFLIARGGVTYLTRGIRAETESPTPEGAP